MTDPLLLAIIFISAGLALGLLAYLATVFLRDRGAQDEVGSGEEVQAAETGVSDEATLPSASSVSESPAEAPAFSASEAPALRDRGAQDEAGSGDEVHAAETAGSDEATLPTASSVSESPGEAPATSASEAPTLPTRLPLEVAILLRDPMTGSLLLKIRERVFRTPAELEGNESLPALGEAATSLLRWVAQARGTQQAPDAVPLSAPDRPVSHLPTIIEQINEIVKRRAALEEGKLKSVQLAEGPDGDARVYVGLNSYRLDEIPDGEVRRIIREAVAEWEKLE